MEVNEPNARYSHQATEYKMTDVGRIPCSWSVGVIGDLAETSSGTTPPRAAYGRYYQDGHIAWVKTLDLNNAEIHATDEMVTSAALAETSLRVYPPGSVLVAMYGGLNQIGRTGLLRIPAAVNQALTAIRPRRSKVDPGYLLRVLNHRIEHWRTVASSSRKDPNITSKDVRDFPLALPSLEEQQAIAEALSDSDDLIESLSLLLVKKRQIKQGAMQELLTGKKRLLGFGDARSVSGFALPIGWQRFHLSQVADVKTGPFGSALHEKDYVQSGIPIITVEHLGEAGIDGDGAPQVSAADAKRLQAYTLQEGDIVFSRVGSIDRNSWVSRDQVGWLFSGRLLRLRMKGPVASSRFLSYFFQCEWFKQQVISVAVGQTMASLNTRIVGGLEIRLPSMAEQDAIVELLSSLDCDISGIESRLEKARDLKQAMMQALLTGRIRLAQPT